ncbi:hypothetical protein TNIN_373311 [Trichonephila inaurata madagascariensis]|uniref:Uncharacterized protein n=1 Tax=Trichonephila inaurata madagascariensis TaxID=2747483 RepID=A0A8X6K2D1_9ARAC|nr:hypothetical protein TNIN_373311 [Trichonephila inaurata madagascariensis]
MSYTGRGLEDHLSLPQACRVQITLKTVSATAGLSNPPPLRARSLPFRPQTKMVCCCNRSKSFSKVKGEVESLSGCEVVHPPRKEVTFPQHFHFRPLRARGGGKHSLAFLQEFRNGHLLL